MNFVEIGGHLINMNHVLCIRDRTRAEGETFTQIIFLGGEVVIQMPYDQVRNIIKTKTGLNF